jgi:hypothetical protein
MCFAHAVYVESIQLDDMKLRRQDKGSLFRAFSKNRQNSHTRFQNFNEFIIAGDEVLVEQSLEL